MTSPESCLERGDWGAGSQGHGRLGSQSECKKGVRLQFERREHSGIA